jgi:hypothetical protein
MDIEKLKSDGILSDTPPIHIETLEEKEQIEYMKSIGVRSISMIMETIPETENSAIFQNDCFQPIVLIKYDDGEEEIIKLEKEQVKEYIDCEFDIRYLFNLSNKLYARGFLGLNI